MLGNAIGRLERSLRQKDFEESSRLVNELLTDLESMNTAFGATGEAHGSQVETEATRLAAALTNYIADPELSLSDSVLSPLIKYHRVIAQVFEISGFRGTEHVVELLGQHDADNRVRLSGDEIIRLLSLLSINDLTEDRIAMLGRQKMSVQLPATLGYLSEQHLWTESAEANRTQLLELASKWEETSEIGRGLSLLTSTWMGCSYAEAPDKHAFKAMLNRQIRHYLDGKGLADVDLPPVRVDKSRPTVLIIAESYQSSHAMHRCYGPAIRSLRPAFHTILLINREEPDPETDALFDEVLRVEIKARNLGDLIEIARSKQPDIVYFPSVGLRPLGIFAANLRLAPIQIATNGHPASTMSDKIDYMILVEEVFGGEDCFSETVILRKPDRHYLMRSDAKPVASCIRRSPDTVRLAVPAWSRKITPTFLQACRSIADRSQRDIEFRFFPNVLGSQFQAMCRRLGAMLPCRVYPRASYNEYIRELNDCDIHLSTFPFGAANGIIDSARQGLPMVNLVGPQPHARIDMNLVRRLDQPGWLTAATVEEYIDAVCRLVEDDSLRVAISQAILDCDPDSHFLVAPDETNTDFEQIFSALYRSHETLKTSERRVWRHDELIDAPGQNQYGLHDQ